MNFKKLFLIIIFISIFLSLSSIYASENITPTTNEFEEVLLPDEDTNELYENTQNLSKNEEFNNINEINTNKNDKLSQYNDNEKLGGNLIKTQISVSNYGVTLNPTSKSFYISNLNAKVQTTSGKSISTGGVYFEIYKNSYDKIKTYEVEVEKGVAKYTHKIEATLSPNKYTCKAYYLDRTQKYDSSSCTFYLTVRTKTELTVNDVMCNIGNSVTISSSLKSGIGSQATKYGNVIYTINSQRYITTGSLTLNMYTAGKIKCTAQYIGTSYYLNSTEKTFYITVKDITNIVYSLESTKILAGDKINLNYKVIDSTGNTVSNGIVKITQPTPKLISTAYYDSLQSYRTYGQASITAPDMPGEYTYGIYYSNKNTDFQNSAKGFTVFIYSTSKISSSLIKSNVGKTKDIELTVKDHLGKNIDEGIVKSEINGKTYSANVKNGKAVLKNVKMPLKPNTYQYTVTYSTSTGFYTNSNCIIKILCSHESKIKVKSITGRAGKKVKLTATVKDGLGNKIKKGTIKFKINGKTYKAKVKNGKATKKIKIPKAKVSNEITKKSGNICKITTYYKTIYSCKALFGGYKQYPKGSSNFKVTSKKKPITKKYIIKTSNKKKASSKSKSKNIDADIFLRQDYYTFWFNYNGHTLGNMPVTYKIYTGSTYKEYQSQTDYLGFVDIYHISKGKHKIYVEGHYLLDSKSYKSTFTVYRG